MPSKSALHIELRGGFPLRQLNRLLAAVKPLADLTEQRTVRLDLAGLAYISPASLASLVAVVRDRIDSGLILEGSHFVEPRNRLVAMYLARMNFHRLLAADDAPEYFVRRPAQQFLPLFAFGNRDEAEAVSKDLTRVASNALKDPSLSRPAVLLATMELAQNVLDHAHSPTGGHAVAQLGRAQAEFEVAFADTGVGILASLRANPKYTDLHSHLSALRTALEPGATADPKSSGMYLALLKQAVCANGGSFVLRSGTAALEVGRREHASDVLPSFRGTVAAIRIRTDRRFALPRVRGLTI